MGWFEIRFVGTFDKQKSERVQEVNLQMLKLSVVDSTPDSDEWSLNMFVVLLSMLTLLAPAAHNWIDWSFNVLLVLTLPLLTTVDGESN